MPVVCSVWNVDVGTLFTTHATLLGRYLCAGDADFYNKMDKVRTRFVQYFVLLSNGDHLFTRMKLGEAGNTYFRVGSL